MLNYKVINNNHSDWVVMIHGAGGNIETWFRQVPDYARHFNLLLVDLIGHGESQDMSLIENLSFELVADQIMEVIDHLKIKTANFLALSVGAIVARLIAEKHPERVKKMVLAGAITSLSYKAKFLVKLADTFKRIIPFSILRWFLVKYVVPNKNTYNTYMKGVKKVCYESFLLWMTIVNKMSIFLSKLFSNRCEIPTLYLMGDSDKLFLAQVQDLVKQDKEFSSLVIVPNAGHACNIENKRFFNRVSIDFFQAA